MTKNVDFQQTVETAFLTYGASVAQERAIPDVRDMLKIGLRQGLYAQFTNKLTHKDKFQKAQKSVAAAMAQSYVHGDVAMYDTFIRAARPWSYRYPLEDVQGSYGNPSSPDSHAAARYVEMRAGELSDYFFAGLKKNAITEWYNNYDDTELIPSVFPSIGYWNIVNGCSGIAVAMATSVPQFNLKEVNEALIKIINNPSVPFEDIYCVPDFSCGGTIENADEVKDAIKNGSGKSIRMCAKLTYFPDKNMIRATELPYGVFTNTIIDQLAEITEKDPDYGIEKVTDYTKKEADIHIYLAKDANPDKMMRKLYHDTSLENYFAINMIMLDQGRFPKVFGWREACDAYIKHIQECERNIIQFDLDKALARKNIVEGLIKACSIIDEIVALIRASDSPAQAEEQLISVYSFNVEQAKAILAIKLANLTKLDIVKLNDELLELNQKIEWYNHLLNDCNALNAELIKILQEVSNKFGDERRTKFCNFLAEGEEPEVIEEKELAVLIYNDTSIVKVVEPASLKKYKAPSQTIYTTNLNSLLCFTNVGKMYSSSINDLDLGKEYKWNKLFGFGANEIVELISDTLHFNHYKSLVCVTTQGLIKKSAITEYNIHSKKVLSVIKLNENDTLSAVILSDNDKDNIVIISSNNYYNCYPLEEISYTGRMTKGVKAIKLDIDEYVSSAKIANEGFETTSRATKGRKISNE